MEDEAGDSGSNTTADDNITSTNITNRVVDLAKSHVDYSIRGLQYVVGAVSPILTKLGMSSEGGSKEVLCGSKRNSLSAMSFDSVSECTAGTNTPSGDGTNSRSGQSVDSSCDNFSLAPSLLATFPPSFSSNTYQLTASWFDAVDEIIAPQAEQVRRVYDILLTEWEKLYQNPAVALSLQAFLTACQERFTVIWCDDLGEIVQCFYVKAEGTADTLDSHVHLLYQLDSEGCRQQFHQDCGAKVMHCFFQQLGRPSKTLYFCILCSYIAYVQTLRQADRQQNMAEETKMASRSKEDFIETMKKALGSMGAWSDQLVPPLLVWYENTPVEVPDNSADVIELLLAYQSDCLVHMQRAKVGYNCQTWQAHISHTMKEQLSLLWKSMLIYSVHNYYYYNTHTHPINNVYARERSLLRHVTSSVRYVSATTLKSVLKIDLVDWIETAFENAQDVARPHCEASRKGMAIALTKLQSVMLEVKKLLDIINYQTLTPPPCVAKLQRKLQVVVHQACQQISSEKWSDVPSEVASCLAKIPYIHSDDPAASAATKKLQELLTAVKETLAYHNVFVSQEQAMQAKESDTALQPTLQDIQLEEQKLLEDIGNFTQNPQSQHVDSTFDARGVAEHDVLVSPPPGPALDLTTDSVMDSKENVHNHEDLIGTSISSFGLGQNNLSQNVVSSLSSQHQDLNSDGESYCEEDEMVMDMMMADMEGDEEQSEGEDGEFEGDLI